MQHLYDQYKMKKKNGEASKGIHVKEDNLHIKTKSLFELGI